MAKTTQKQKTTAKSKVIVLSETQVYTFKEQVGSNVTLLNENRKEIVVSERYMKEILSSSCDYEREEKKTKTELADILLSNPYRAMELSFQKKVDEKTIVQEALNASKNSTLKDLEKNIAEAVKKAANGEERIIIGYHKAHQNDFGRLDFIDMEQKNEVSAGYDKRTRQVDPRTINYIIVNKVKYSLK